MKKRSQVLETVVHGVFLLLGLITVGCVLLISVYLIVSGIPAIRKIGLITMKYTSLILYIKVPYFINQAYSICFFKIRDLQRPKCVFPNGNPPSKLFFFRYFSPYNMCPTSFKIK